MRILEKRHTVTIGQAVDDTSHATTHADPTYAVDVVVHYSVANIPAAGARTSTYALNNVTLPHALRIAKLGWRAARSPNPHLAPVLYVQEDKITYEEAARDLGYD